MSGPQFIPRIRGRVGQIESGADKDKWAFELSLWNLQGTQRIGDPWLIGPFETEAIAQEKLKDAVKIACEAIEKHETGSTSGQYMDLKNGGVMRPWVEH